MRGLRLFHGLRLFQTQEYHQVVLQKEKKMQGQHSFEHDLILIACENPFYLIQYSRNFISLPKNKGETMQKRMKLNI